MTVLSHLRNISYHFAILLKNEEQNKPQTPDFLANWDKKYIKETLDNPQSLCDGGISLVLLIIKITSDCQYALSKLQL